MKNFIFWVLRCPLSGTSCGKCFVSNGLKQPQPSCCCTAIFGFYIQNNSLLDEYLCEEFINFLSFNAFGTQVIPIRSCNNGPVTFGLHNQKTTIDIEVIQNPQNPNTPSSPVSKRFDLYYNSRCQLCNTMGMNNGLLFPKVVQYSVNAQKFKDMSRYIQSLQTL